DLCAVHAKKRESIQQEIWARMILYNISFIMAHHIINKKPKGKGKKKKYSYAINKKKAIHHCRYFIQHYKRKGGHPPDLEIDPLHIFIYNPYTKIGYVLCHLPFFDNQIHLLASFFHILDILE
ncbi:hypothetical protein MKA29_11940, partial [[Clostridium] innocuum]|nr:hypothetical protein [[Clostridium] innocuum]